MRLSTARRRTRRQIIPAVVLAVVGVASGAVLVSGCGDTASAGSAPESIAGYIPAESAVYFQVSTDTDGAQWTQIKQLGALFPGYAAMSADFEAALAREGVDWDTDLKPLLGEAVALAITDVPGGASGAAGTETATTGAAGTSAMPTSPDGMSTDGMTTDGMTTDGMTTDGMTTTTLPDPTTTYGTSTDGTGIGMAMEPYPGRTNPTGVDGTSTDGTSTTTPGATSKSPLTIGTKHAMLAVLQIAPDAMADVTALITDDPSGLTKTGEYQGATMYSDAAVDMSVAVAEESLIIGSSEEVVRRSLDAHASGGEAVLSGVVRFNDALALLPKDVFAMAYVNLDVLGLSATDAIPQVGSLVGDQVTGAAAMSVTAEPGGLRMKAVVVDGPPIFDQTSFAPTLTRQAPADCVVYIGFNRLADTVSAALAAASESGTPDTKKQIDALTTQLPSLLGVNGDDLRNLTGGEHAVVVTRESPTPGVSLALRTADGAHATKSLTALSKSLPAVFAQFGGSDTVIGDWTTVDLKGTTGRQLSLGTWGGIVWGVRGNLAVVGSRASGVASVLAPRAVGTSLAAAPAFGDATRGMPSQVSGLAWVNMREVSRLLAANGAFDGKGGARMRANLAPITSVAAWTTSGTNPTLEVFVGMAP
ncbi:MAG: DUF3352 domain-containing protein [Thermoleophilia bacterium]|nr:DUF3352 domain-containing protein [Thermoleophilia bacterium]